MAHIAHADADVIRQDLERLETKYIMGLEVSSYVFYSEACHPGITANTANLTNIANIPPPPPTSLRHRVRPCLLQPTEPRGRIKSTGLL